MPMPCTQRGVKALAEMCARTNQTKQEERLAFRRKGASAGTCVMRNKIEQRLRCAG
jgi:hypothetical protein